MTLFWIAVAVVCLILELTAGNFFIICFCAGAAASAVSAFLGTGIYFQVITFAAVSVASIFFLRPLAMKYFHKDGQERKSNADALIGRTGKVTEKIEKNGYGRVAVDGDVWKANTPDGEEIPENTIVKITDRKSIIVTVVKNN